MAKPREKPAQKSSLKINDLSDNTENGAAQFMTTKLTDSNSVHFVNEACKHCKAIATGAEGVAFLKDTFVKEIETKNINMEEEGVITDGNADKFIACIAKHRFWNREEFRKVPA